MWPQLAQLVRPPWVAKRERDTVSLLIDMAQAEEGADTWQMAVDVAKRWRQEDLDNPPAAGDAGAFRGLFAFEETEKRKEKRLQLVAERDPEGQSL